MVRLLKTLVAVVVCSVHFVALTIASLYGTYVAPSNYGFLIEKGQPVIAGWAGSRTVHYVPGADPATFKPLPSEDDDNKVIYAKDARQVYIGFLGSAKAIASSDPATFAVLTADATYAKDRAHVYWYGVEIPEADPPTFRVLKAPYSIDASRVYVGITPTEVHSLDDFEVVNVYDYTRPIRSDRRRLVKQEPPDDSYVSGWSRDGVAYYWGAHELEGADYDSLMILNAGHAKDEKDVFFRDQRISGADPETFVTVGPGVVSGQDKDSRYDLGRWVGHAKD